MYKVTAAQIKPDLLDKQTTQQCPPFGSEPKSHVLLIVMIWPLSSGDSQTGTYNAAAYKFQQRQHEIWDASCFYKEILNLSECLSNNSLHFYNVFHPSNLKYLPTKCFIASEE